VRERGRGKAPGPIVLDGGGDHQEEGRVLARAEDVAEDAQDEEVGELVGDEDLCDMTRGVSQAVEVDLGQ
jgi:hypothetical protein